MQHRDFASNYRENFLEWWSNITLIRWTKHDRDSWSKRNIVTGNFRKPIIAAVNGYALGGGCEVSCFPFSSRVQNVVPHFFAILGINFRRVWVSIEGRDDKNCQRHNGPKDWVHLAKVASWSHIRSSNINHDHISSSESRLSINKKSQPNISISTKLKIQNLDQT